MRQHKEHIFAAKDLDMENMEIRIDTNAIRHRLYRMSGHISLSRHAMGGGEKIADIVRLTDDEKQTIEELVPTAVNDVAAVIGRIFPSCTTRHIDAADGNTTVYAICFGVPHNYPTELATNVERYAEEFVLYNILRQWMQLVKPDEAATVQSEMEKNIRALQMALTARKKPTKDETEQDNIIEL